MSHEAAIAAAGGRFLGEAHGTVWFTDPETQSTLALPTTELTADNIALTLLRSRRSFRQEQFRLLIEGLQDYAILMLDQSGSIVSWNTGAERIYGYSPQEIIGNPVMTLYFGSEQELIRHALEQARREGRFEGEMWKRRKDGGAIWGDVVITALRDEAEQVRGYSYVCRDITRRHIEHQRQQARLCVTRVLTEGTTPERVLPAFLDCVCEHLEWDFAEFWMRTNHDNRITLRAAHCPRDDDTHPHRHLYSGETFPIEQIFPEHVASGMHPMVVQHNGESYLLGQMCFAGDTVETTLIIPLRDQNSVYAWVLFGHRHRREPGSGEIEVVEDLTQLLQRYLQQERAESRLQRMTRQMQDQASLLDRILNASPDLIYLLDRAGRYTYVNAKAAAILGFEPEFMVGKLPGELGFPEERIARLEQERQQVIDSGRPWQGETSFPVVHGIREFEYIMTPIWGWEGRIESVVVSARDITERKRVEERLRVMVDQLPAILWTTDESLCITSSLGAGLRPLELQPDELKGSRLPEVAHGQIFEAAALEAHEKALQGQRVVYRTILKQRLFNVWVQPLRRLDGSIHGTIGLAFDLTEQTLAKASACNAESETCVAWHGAGADGKDFTLARQYLNVTHALLTDMAARLNHPEEQPQRQLMTALLDEIQSISRQIEDLSGPTSSMSTDAA